MVAFTLFWFPVYRYGLLYAVSFILWYFRLTRIWKKWWFKNYPNIQFFLTDGAEDLILTIALGVILGGRLGHVLIYGNWYYFSHPGEILQVWKGWMSFIWWIIWVVLCLCVYCFCKKLKKREILCLFDIILVFVPLGIVLGRFWNYLNQELYWIMASDLPDWLYTILYHTGLLHVYQNVDHFLRVNTNFLSMLLEGLLLYCIQAVVFVKMVIKKRFNIWRLSTNFLLYYSIIRFFLEYLRADSQLEYIWGYTKSQWFFMCFILIALWIKLILKAYNNKKNLTITLA